MGSDVNKPEEKVLKEIELNIQTEDLLLKKQKERQETEDALSIEFNLAAFEGKRQAKIAEEMAEARVEDLKRLSNVTKAITTFAEDMISSTNLEKPSISLLEVGKVFGLENVVTFYFFDNRYFNAGEFYLPYLIACDWDSEDGEVTVSIYDVLLFNLQKQVRDRSFKSGNYRVFTSEIWEKDKKASKLLRRMKMK